MSKFKTCTSYDELEEKLKTYIKDDNEIKEIRKAYDYAKDVHKNEKRLNGDDFMIHPLTVAYILADINADYTTIMGALLHEVMEHDIDKEEFKKIFGDDIYNLVSGITKINKLNFTGDNESVIQNQRKIFVGLSEDVRVIIIKLADRLHNLKTLYVFDEKKQKKIAKETLDILTPIAHRLGISSLKTPLEELSLRYLKPDEYYDIVEKLNATKAERDASVQKMIEAVSEILDEHGIKFKIKGRSKSIYSIYKKLEKGKRFSEIYDLLALRVLVNTESECYQVLGLIHAKFKPKPNRFKDYIAMPKTNMYQSLHTTVFGVDGQLYEIQIRTYDMDNVAEKGIASHWSYKENGSGKKAIQTDMEQKLQFFKSIMELKDSSSNEEEFVNSVKDDVLKNTIYVFTPKGDVIELPNGATPVDFAYKVHTKVGNSMTGAIVNSSIVPLNYQLQNNDICKVITSNNSAGPNYEWLKFVKTTQAKNKIKSFFSKHEREENIKNGEEEFNRELKKRKLEFTDDDLAKLKYKTMDEMYRLIGEGKLSVDEIFERISKEDNKEEEIINKNKKISNRKVNPISAINVNGIENIKVEMASCCTPIPGDKIIGYITKGNGIKVHRLSCPNISSSHRLINVSWNETDQRFLTRIAITKLEDKDILLNIITKATNMDIGVKNIYSYDDRIELDIMVKDLDELNKFMKNISSLKGVKEVERLIK